MICLLWGDEDKKYEQLNNNMYITDTNLPIYYIMHLFFFINIMINILTNYTHTVLTVYNEIFNFMEDHLPEDDPNIFHISTENNNQNNI